MQRIPAVLLVPLTLAAGCKTDSGAPAAEPSAARSTPRGDSPAVAAKPPVAREDHVLLAVDWMEEGGTTTEVFAVMPAAGGFAQPVIADSASSARFYERWLNPGHRYTVLRGGRTTGSLTIAENDAQGCMALTAATRASVSESGFHGSGLATSAPIGRDSAIVDQAAGADLAAVTALLRRELESTGESWSPDAEVKALLVALPGGGAAVVGSAAIRDLGEEADQRARAATFIIAERAADGSLQPAVTWKRARGDQEAEDEQFERRFVDAADLDGDGTPEIVARTAMTESWLYTIYKRGPGGWTEVYRGGGGGC
ncbi:MAG TPA: hypothetical protein VFS20_10455 [Longimicrobium sp.]|nr:hypothetical protein [Longimicrobium sp.]